MRSLSSPQSSRRASLSSPACDTAAPASPATPLHAALGPPEATPQTPPPSCSTLVGPQSIPTPGVTDLVMENDELRSEVANLTEKLQSVLDHSIESDTRLLQFTNEIFVAKSSRANVSALDSGVQCELLTSCCECAANKDIVDSLRTTMEVLEAELRCLREKERIWECRDDKRDSEWIVVHNGKKSPLQTKNKSQDLSDPLPKVKPKNPVVRKEKKVGKKTTANINPLAKHSKPSSVRSQPTKPQTNHHLTSAKRVAVDTVSVQGDSHVRHLAGLIGALVTPSTKVSGICKPGAGLLDIISSPPPSNSCTVLIAGTNDVADGRHHIVYKHLERIINRLTAVNSKVVVSSLPLRHDLPYYHPVNEETVLVNAFIEDLCASQKVEFLDFNKIGRRWFTRHGMHLRMRGKRILAGLILESVAKAEQTTTTSGPHPTAAPLPVAVAARAERAASTAHPPPITLAAPPAADVPSRRRAERAASTTHPPPVTPTTAHPAGPFVLPHNSYAEAVKLPSPEVTPVFLENNGLTIRLD